MHRQRLFVLRTVRQGDSNLVVHALTSQGAKIALFAAGALRSRKRFGGGVLEPTHYIEAVYKPLKWEQEHRSLAHLKEAVLIDGFPGLRQDYDRLQMALYVLNVVSRLSQEGVEDAHDIYNLLGNTLKALESITHLDRLKTLFELKVLYYQGVLPEIDQVGRILRVAMSDSDRIQEDLDRWPQMKAQIHGALGEYIGR